MKYHEVSRKILYTNVTYMPIMMLSILKVIKISIHAA